MGTASIVAVDLSKKFGVIFWGTRLHKTVTYYVRLRESQIPLLHMYTGCLSTYASASFMSIPLVRVSHLCYVYALTIDAHVFCSRCHVHTCNLRNYLSFKLEKSLSGWTLEHFFAPKWMWWACRALVAPAQASHRPHERRRMPIIYKQYPCPRKAGG